MKTAGIIAEYNPFHNGHRYHLEQVKKRSDADYVIIVMSGNFVQRGLPAMLDKYSRAKMALLNGADLVLELPAFYATASAEFFALGAVSLLHNLGVVDVLGFGCENDNIAQLMDAANILFTEPDNYREALQKELKTGCSFPAARSNALQSCMPSDSAISDLLSTPNNILALEYLKALRSLNSTMIPLAIKRQGSGYHEENLTQNLSSALAIRNALLRDKDIHILKGNMPDSALTVLKENYLKTHPVAADDLSYLLHYKLLLSAKEGYTQYLDISTDLSDKIKKNLPLYKDFDSFCMLLKSKDMTYSRICRCMIHILLDIKQDTMQELKQNGLTPYARILGFREESAPLLREIKKNSSIPLISTAADAKAFLSNLTADCRNECAQKLFDTDILAARIYSAMVLNRYGISLPDEFGAPLLKV